jgi:hypothetical protein
MLEKNAERSQKLPNGFNFRKALGVALCQEVKVNGVKERRLINAASRSLKSAETR